MRYIPHKLEFILVAEVHSHRTD